MEFLLFFRVIDETFMPLTEVFLDINVVHLNIRYHTLRVNLITYGSFPNIDEHRLPSLQ